MSNQNCIFCGIVEDPSQSEVVWNDDVAIAFMDINPVTDGHVLVIPRAHHTALTDLPPETAAHMMRVGQHLARTLRASELKAEGINLFFAEEKVAGQEVFHSHLHVIPRHADDGFVVTGGREGRTSESLAQSAHSLRSALSEEQG